MIRFNVVDDDIVNFAFSRNLPEVVCQLGGKGTVNCIHQGFFFIHNQIGIICSAPVG